MQKVGVDISDALDEAGLTPREQVAVLGGILALAFAAYPEPDRARAIEAHIEGLKTLDGNNLLVRQ